MTTRECLCCVIRRATQGGDKHALEEARRRIKQMSVLSWRTCAADWGALYAHFGIQLYAAADRLIYLQFVWFSPDLGDDPRSLHLTRRELLELAMGCEPAIGVQLLTLLYQVTALSA